MTEFRQVSVGEVELKVAIQGGGPLVVMVHGFPESWYSWRHQMDPIAAAGFTACAIDVRGYGGSDRPQSVAAYDMESMVADVAGVIEHLSPDGQAILIGHDWGAPIIWNTALVRPDRVRAVCALAAPYQGVPDRSFDDVFEEVFTARGRFFYQVYFADEGVAEAELEADVRGALRRLYYAWSGEATDEAWPSNKRVGDKFLTGLTDPDQFPEWLSETDIDFMVSELERSGFRGALNRYRNYDRDYAFLRQFKGRRIEQPALFIAGDRDMGLSMFRDWRLLMAAEVPNLRGIHLLADCGHWTQQERPTDVNNLLLPWLISL